MSTSPPSSALGGVLKMMESPLVLRTSSGGIALPLTTTVTLEGSHLRLWVGGVDGWTGGGVVAIWWDGGLMGGVEQKCGCWGTYFLHSVDVGVHTFSIVWMLGYILSA